MLTESPFGKALSVLPSGSGQGLELRVQASGARRYAVGERVRLHLPAERLRLIKEE